MPVVEDRKELPVARQIGSEARAGERVRQRVCGEARLALLTVGNNRFANPPQSPDRVGGSVVLRRDELLPADRSLVVVGIRLLKLHRSRQRTDELGGNGHAASSSFVGTGGGSSVEPIGTSCRRS